MMFFIFKLAMSMAISSIASAFFAPSERRKKADADKESIDQDEVPSAKIGNSIPVVFGNRWVTSPNVIYWKKTKTESVASYRKHYVDLHMALAHGPVEAVTGISVNKKKAIASFPLTPADLLASPSDLHVVVSYRTKAGGTFEFEVARWAGDSVKFTGNSYSSYYMNNGSRVQSLNYNSPIKDPTVLSVGGSVTGFIETNYGSQTQQQGEQIQAVLDLMAGRAYEEVYSVSDPSAPNLGFSLPWSGSTSLSNTVRGTLIGVDHALGYPEMDGDVFTLKVKHGSEVIQSEQFTTEAAFNHYSRYALGYPTPPGPGTFGGIYSHTRPQVESITAKITHTGETIAGKVVPLFKVELYWGTRGQNYYRYDSTGDSFLEWEHRNDRLVELKDIAVPIPSTSVNNQGLVGCIPMDMPNVFGGYKQSGGLKGDLCVINGGGSIASGSILHKLFQDQIAENKELPSGESSGAYAGYTPVAYGGLVSVVLRDFYIVANSGSIAPWHFSLQNRSVTIPELDVYRRIGNHANAACVLYEILTNKKWGKGLDPSLIDVSTFISAAKTLHEEELGFGLVWYKEASIDDFMGTVAKHAFGGWSVDVFRSGKIQFNLFREFNGDRNALHTLNPLKVASFKRKSAQEVTNEVQVKWKYHTTVADVDRVEIVRNMSHITRSNGAVNSTTVNLPGIPDSKSAKYLATLHLHSEGYPLAVLEFSEDIMSGSYIVGDYVVFDDPEYVDKPTLFRVTNIRAKDDVKEVIATEDVFSYSALGNSETTIRKKELGFVRKDTTETYEVYPFEATSGVLFLKRIVNQGSVHAKILDDNIYLTVSSLTPNVSTFEVEVIDANGALSTHLITVNTVPSAAGVTVPSPLNITVPSGGVKKIQLSQPWQYAITVVQDTPDCVALIDVDDTRFIRVSSNVGSTPSTNLLRLTVGDVYGRQVEQILNVTIS